MILFGDTAPSTEDSTTDPIGGSVFTIPFIHLDFMDTDIPTTPGMDIEVFTETVTTEGMCSLELLEGTTITLGQTPQEQDVQLKTTRVPKVQESIATVL